MCQHLLSRRYCAMDYQWRIGGGRPLAPCTLRPANPASCSERDCPWRDSQRIPVPRSHPIHTINYPKTFPAPEVRVEALRIFEEEGADEAAEYAGVVTQTIYKWRARQSVLQMEEGDGL